MSERISSYEEFWPVYVRFHAHPVNRLLHLVGTTAAVASLGAFALTGRKRFLAAVPVFGYGLAWVGHFLVEGNRPATFDHPAWSLRGDFEMILRMLNGTMDAEVERHTAPPADPTPPAEEPEIAATTPVDVN
jgi:hypothetical protein